MSGGISIVGMMFGMVGWTRIVGMILGMLVAGIFGTVGNGAAVFAACGVTVTFSNGVGLRGTELSVG